MSFFFFLSDIICFCWKWERGFRSSCHDGKHWNSGSDAVQRHLFISSVCQCPHKSSIATFFCEYWKYIRYCKRREKRNFLPMDMQHPVDNRRTDGPAHCLVEPRPDGQTMMTKRWNGPPSPCPQRERDGIDFSMMARDWSASWMLVISPARAEENKEIYYSKYL